MTPMVSHDVEWGRRLFRISVPKDAMHEIHEKTHRVALVGSRGYTIFALDWELLFLDLAIAARAHFGREHLDKNYAKKMELLGVIVQELPFTPECRTHYPAVRLEKEKGPHPLDVRYREELKEQAEQDELDLLKLRLYTLKRELRAKNIQVPETTPPVTLDQHRNDVAAYEKLLAGHKAHPDTGRMTHGEKRAFRDSMQFPATSINEAVAMLKESASPPRPLRKRPPPPTTMRDAYGRIVRVGDLVVLTNPHDPPGVHKIEEIERDSASGHKAWMNGKRVYRTKNEIRYVGKEQTLNSVTWARGSQEFTVEVGDIVVDDKGNRSRVCVVTPGRNGDDGEERVAAYIRCIRMNQHLPEDHPNAFVTVTLTLDQVKAVTK